MNALRLIYWGLLLSIANGFADTPDLFIRVSQIGFKPKDAKLAVAFSKADLPGSFQIYKAGEENAASARPVFKGTSAPINDVAWGQWTHHSELDFSKFTKPGRYVLRVGKTCSVPFTIGENVYSELPDQLLEFMRQQRCGYNPWLGKECHTLDGRTAFGPLPYGTHLDSSGGWHDAADLLKYLLTSGNATAQLLLAYEFERESGRRYLQDRVNARGDSGTNGIPDVLDEARWGLEWMLKLHPAPGQLYHQVADDRDHCGPRLPYAEIAEYGWGKGGARVVYFADGKPQGLSEFKSDSTGIANLAGRYAAAMGLGYKAFKGIDQQFAEKCLKAGIEVYRMGKEKEGVQQGNSFKAPYRYEETTWTDDMEWGAAVLFQVTGEQRYLKDGMHYAELAQSESWMGQEQTKHYQYYPFMNVGHYMLYDSVDKKFKRVLAGYYRDGIERCIRMAHKNPYRSGVPFIWCSNNLMVGLATQCLLYERMTGDTQYRQFTAKQRDWLMGRNPWGTSMFTGIPENGDFPTHPHLTTARLTKRAIRGGLVDGPVYERIFKSLKGVGITEPDPYAPFQGELAVYHDDYLDYSSNEPTMDGTASAILMWVLCN